MQKLQKYRSQGRMGILCLLLMLLALVASAQVYTGDLHLETQAEVDGLNVQEVTGNVVIEGTQITNLDGMSELTKIGGNLYIHQNNQLVSVAGLGSLQQVEGNYVIANNPRLAALRGPAAIVRIGGYVVVAGNAALETISGFEQLETVGSFIDISNNAKLVSISGLEKLRQLNGYLLIRANPALEIINDFNQLQDIGGALVISYHARLRAIPAFPLIQLHRSYMEITDNAAITHLDGLSNIAVVAGWVKVERNAVLNNLDGLAALERVVGDLVVADNPALDDCCAILPMLQDRDAIHGQVDIRDNACGCRDESVIAAACANQPSEPVANCRPLLLVVLDREGKASITVDDIDQGSTMPCGIAARSLSRYNFSCADIRAASRQRPSIVPVTLTVTGHEGQRSSCVSRVEVRDFSAPQVRCRNAVISLPREGRYNLQPTELVAEARDACGLTLALSKQIFTCTDQGTNAVTLTARDPSGNSFSCTMTVTVNAGQAECGTAVAAAAPTSAEPSHHNGMVPQPGAFTDPPVAVREAALQLYPNPTTGNLTILLPDYVAEAILTIQDQQGHTVWRQTVVPQQASISLMLDAARFPTGLYFVRWQAADGSSRAERLVVAPR